MKLGIQIAMLLLMAAPASSGFYRTYPDGEGVCADWDEFEYAFEIPGVGYAAYRWEIDYTPPAQGPDGLVLLDIDGNITGLLVDSGFYWEYAEGQLVLVECDCDDVLHVRWFDPGGVLLDARSYQLPENGWVVRDIASSDIGELIVCAKLEWTNSLAVKIAPDRSLEWTRMFPEMIGGWPWVEFETIGISGQGDIHFGLDDNPGGVYCLDSGGDLRWRALAPTESDVIQVAETDFGCVMVCQDCIAAFDQEGGELWTVVPPEQGVVFSGIADAGGGAVVAYSFHTGGGAACLEKLDSNGQVIWSREYPPSGHCTVRRCLDGGFLLAGASEPYYGPTEPYNYIDPLLIKTDVNGWFGSEGIEPGQEPGCPVITLPSNPVQSMTSVTVAAPAGESIEMELFEMSGRIVTSWSWQSDGETCIELPHLGPGMYFLVATSGDGQTTARFVVVD